MSKFEVYKNKRVLITGHTGFKGTWMSLWLRELGADVLGYSLDPPTKPSIFESVNLEKKVKHVIGDIRDENKLFSVFDEFKPEFVFHLAAQPLVRFSYREPKITYETNVMGTVNIFEAIKKTTSVRVFINVTSDKCYENKDWHYGYREIDPIGGNDPYSSSKGCVELITAAYRCSFFNIEKYHEHKVSISSVRAGNVIGGGDWGEERLVPDCIKSLTKDKDIFIRYSRAIRPWQFVLEPLSGYLWLGALMYNNGIKYGGAWNFGPDNSEIVSVEELVKLIINVWGKGKYCLDTSSHKHEERRLRLDCGKANDLLKWKSIYNINETVEETVSWYKDYYASTMSSNLHKKSLDHILRYTEKAKKMRVEWSID